MPRGEFVSDAVYQAAIVYGKALDTAAGLHVDQQLLKFRPDGENPSWFGKVIVIM